MKSEWNFLDQAGAILGQTQEVTTRLNAIVRALKGQKEEVKTNAIDDKNNDKIDEITSATEISSIVNEGFEANKSTLDNEAKSEETTANNSDNDKDRNQRKIEKLERKEERAKLRALKEERRKRNEKTLQKQNSRKRRKKDDDKDENSENSNDENKEKKARLSVIKRE